jgi:hypothetical protein
MMLKKFENPVENLLTYLFVKLLETGSAAAQGAATGDSARVSVEQQGAEQGQRNAPGKAVCGNYLGVIVRIIFE